jgi:hypothetical protein
VESLAGAWNPVYATLPDLNYKIENKPYIKAKEESEESLIGFLNATA